ncbi:unnamed protein product [Closterium sp. Yama58-4]|nr:unnamed protein product [Closterium sp. Yama58-4]
MVSITRSCLVAWHAALRGWYGTGGTAVEALDSLAREWKGVKGTSTWKSGRDCGSMDGVRCDGDGHVIALFIRECTLTGPLFTALLALSNLQYLDLEYCNQLPRSLPDFITESLSPKDLREYSRYLFDSRSLPEQLSQLQKLQSLRLHYINLSGTIPASIGNLTALTTLILSNNSLSGSIPEAISSLKQLQELDLHSNKMSGTIPASIGNLTTLTTLKLSNNHLIGTIPAAITALTNLESLDLSGNQLTGELPSFHHMPYLTSLQAHHNYLTAAADETFPNVPSLAIPVSHYSVCLFHHNCLGNHSMFCSRGENQRRASECRAFCGAQFLTPPCSGHGVCSSFVPDPSQYTYSCCGGDEEEQSPPTKYLPKGQCDCDEGYTPGTAAGTCSPHDTSAMGVALSLLQEPQNRLLLLVVLPLTVLQLAFALPLILRRLNHRRRPTRLFYSKRALAARQAVMGVEITC